MSEPISYATSELIAVAERLGIVLSVAHAEELAARTVRMFLQDARDEGRFDNATIDKLLDEIP